jgi:hypothetical protein
VLDCTISGVTDLAFRLGSSHAKIGTGESFAKEFSVPQSVQFRGLLEMILSGSWRTYGQGQQMKGE